MVHRLVKELAAVENTARDTAVCCGDDCEVSYVMQGCAYFICIILCTCSPAMHVLDCVQDEDVCVSRKEELYPDMVFVLK